MLWVTISIIGKFTGNSIFIHILSLPFFIFFCVKFCLHILKIVGQYWAIDKKIDLNIK